MKPSLSQRFVGSGFLSCIPEVKDCDIFDGLSIKEFIKNSLRPLLIHLARRRVPVI
jgi:hypothetical protein